MGKHNMTPCEYSAAQHSLPFDQHCKGNNSVCWDICKGLVAVTKGERRTVIPSHLYGVVEDGNGGYSIASFGHIREDEPWRRYYSLNTMRRYAHMGMLTELERGLTYDEMAQRVQKDFPGLKMPTIEQFYLQFGLFAEDVEPSLFLQNDDDSVSPED